MDSKELRGLMEAYSGLYAPQEVDEAKQESEEEDWRKSEIRNLRKHRETGTRTPYTDRNISHFKNRGVKKDRGGKIRNEELDIFDTVLEFLQTEGYAETLEDAEFIMANDLNTEVIDAILEARKSYSATSAKAGKDIGKKGKIFGKIAREAGERYGSEERGKKVAGAILAKLRAKHG